MSAGRVPTMLTRRERQIMDGLYRPGRATAARIEELARNTRGERR